MTTQEITPLVPRQGWHVMHLFYHVDHAQWALFSDEEKRQAKTRLTELVQEIRATPDTHLLIFSVATPKADLGFMLLTPDLQVANAYEKQLTLSLGPEILSPIYSYLSQTEGSEYTTTREQYAAETLIAEKGLAENSPEFEAALKEFDERMAHYLQHRLYPVLPDWGVTLLAKDTLDIKSIVYEMRFDEVTARYGEFGDFHIGLQLPLDALFRRICL
jgi:hydrogen peroxide-dependent heme synthase